VADPFIIDVTGLHKRYDGGVEALRGLNLQVPRNSICGFLGRNGAGKTTTIKILLGMASATSGTACVCGLDALNPERSVLVRARAAFVSEEKDLYGSVTVGDMIAFTKGFFPRWRADLEERYTRSFDLPAAREIKALSRGMRAKLALLLALCRGAELLILDEATSALDPAAAEEVMQALVTHVAREDATVFFSSHQLAEVAQIADTVAIVHHGRTVVAGAIDDLRERYQRIEAVFEADAPDAALRSPGVHRVSRTGRMLTIWVNAGADAVVEEVAAMAPASMEVSPATLKELFLDAVASEE
jgi:ABC-2 type transport system ATP-binding protein